MSYPRHSSRKTIRAIAVLILLMSLLAEGSSTLSAGNSTVNPFFADCILPCIENFDNVTAPALPSGWTTTVQTGQPGDLPWTTVTTSFNSSPNSVFVSGAGHTTDIRLDSPAIPIAPEGGILTFRRKHSLEENFDAMVLEISIPSVNGGAFQDIIAAGGSFAEGSYTTIINAGLSTTPIAGRAAWTGTATFFNDFTTTSVRLPNSAKGKSVTFRWRVATDGTGSSQGAFIDNIALILPPSNDNFSNAQPILGRSGIIFGTNLAATKEAGELNHADHTGGASVWYKWQAPEDGRFVFTTFDSGFETVMAVYTGNTLPGTEVASNSMDPNGCSSGFGGGPPFSRVAFDAVGGVFYHIAVDVRRSESTGGHIELRWGGSATISGRVSDVSGRPVPTETIELHGDTCRRTEGFGSILFTDVPKGHNYDIQIRPPGFSIANYNRWGTTASISPLTGDVSNFNFYQASPTKSISGTVTMPGGDTSDLKVMCVSKPFGAGASVPVDFVVTEQATPLGGGKYQCFSLPERGDYIVTPSKLGFSFTPTSITLPGLITNVSNVNFAGFAAPTRTISGRVTQSDGTTGVSGVTLALSGDLMATQVTDANGNYSFTGVLHGGNYTVTPSNANLTFAPTSLSFNNLGADQTAADFTATVLLQLILDETGQVAALDSVLHTRDPFPVVRTANILSPPSVDANTRVVILVSNFALAPGELPSSVVINLVGSNQTFDIPAEDVRPLSDPTFTQIIFRLPDSLSTGVCTLAVKARGFSSNIGTMNIKN